MKCNVLYYNVHYVPSLIEKNNPKIEPYLSENFSDQLFKKYRNFGMDKFNFCYDRTGMVPHYINVKPNLHPIPSYDPTFNKSFSEVFKDRCLELLSFQKPINVVWSGGIDSTLVLLGLMHYANSLEQIKVFGTYGSVIESGNLFDKRIKNKIKYNIQVNSKHQLSAEGEIFVTGCMGNQLFGPTNDFSRGGTQPFFHHQFGSQDTMYEDYTKHIDPELIEFLKPSLDACPKKIETIADFRWYCSFNFDWYREEYSILSKNRNIYNFFNTIDFQKYVLQTEEPFTKVENDPLTHRWVMRDLIAEFMGDSHYARNKRKGVSALSIPDPNWLFLLEDYSNANRDFMN